MSAETLKTIPITRGVLFEALSSGFVSCGATQSNQSLEMYTNNYHVVQSTQQPFQRAILIVLVIIYLIDVGID